MSSLSDTWITDNPIDFELKKYQLLAWLQKVNKALDNAFLYPYLTDLVFHYNNLKKLNQEKKTLFNQFPKKLEKVDLEELKLIYSKIFNDQNLLAEIQDILGFALPEIKDNLDQATDLHNWIYNQFYIEPVGILPLYKDEGYVLLANEKNNNVDIFRYKSSLFTTSTEKYRGVAYNYIETNTRDKFETFNSIKLRLIKKDKDLPNPATFLMLSKLDFPKKETFIPLSKQKLIKFLATA